MIFNSFQYMIFLPVVFLLHWLIPSRHRWILLLIASYYFYMSWNAKYVVLILFTTLVSYLAAILIEATDSARKKKIILLGTLIACLGVLGVFKYFNFFAETLSNLFQAFSIPLHPVTLKLLLPVGISFYTFQTLSYVIDVYRGTIRAEHHFGIYATFVSFFPQLVAGPIERSGNLLHQIRDDREFDYFTAREGLRLMAWGYFKKIALADTLAVYADIIYNNVQANHGLALIIATLFFSIQIYCDFSGYSDIAIGSAKLFNIRLMENFRSPYLSCSVREFWSKWHISLSTWFRDYVYIPLGGNRVSKGRHKINLMITFLVSGLWHGANWTFVLWGGLHGFAQVLETTFSPRKEKSAKKRWVPIKMLFVFCFVTLAWVFFRAQTIHDALYVFCHAFDGISDPARYIYRGYRDMHMQFSLVIRCMIMMIILFLHDLIATKYDIQKLIDRVPVIPRWIGYVFFICLIIILMPIRADQEFIYFQF